MLEDLKQIGVLTEKESGQIVESENVKGSFTEDVLDENALEDFAGMLELLLSVVPETTQQQNQLIEECPCGLVLFGDEQPEYLSEKYDGCFVQADASLKYELMKLFSLTAQKALDEGFDEYGQLEDMMTRFTQFRLCTEENISAQDKLFLVLASGIHTEEDKQEFLDQSEKLSHIAQEQQAEFYTSFCEEGEKSIQWMVAQEKIEA